MLHQKQFSASQDYFWNRILTFASFCTCSNVLNFFDSFNEFYSLNVTFCLLDYFKSFYIVKKLETVQAISWLHTNALNWLVLKLAGNVYFTVKRKFRNILKEIIKCIPSEQCKWYDELLFCLLHLKVFVLQIN